MKKSRPIFEPINFHLAGKIFIIIGPILIIINLLDYLGKWQIIDNSAFIFGVVLIAIGLYLIKIVPKQ